MISDTFEKLRGFFVRTLRPAWRNLFSARLNFVNLFAAILILEVLLGVILLSFSGNLAAEAAVADRAEAVFSDTEVIHKDSREEAEGLLTSGLDLMHTKSVKVFAVALILWLGLSSFVLYKMFSSSVDMGRVVWGLYLTYGSTSRRLRRLLFWQLLSLGGLGLVVSLPISYLICAAVYGFSGRFDLSPLGVLIIVGVTLIIFSLILGLISRRIVGKTCIELLNDTGDGQLIASPKRSSRKLSSDRPMALAATAVRRMRRHYITTALCATLPLCLFFSCLSMAQSGSLRSAGDVTAFTLSFANGFESSDYTDLYKNKLASVSGIIDSRINGCGTAAELGMNLMLRPGEQSSEAETVEAFGGAASEELWYLCGDKYTLADQHYSFTTDPEFYKKNPVCDNGVERVLVETPAKGRFTYIYLGESPGLPTAMLRPQFSPEYDDAVLFTKPDPTLPELSEIIGGDRDGIVLHANDIIRVSLIWQDQNFIEPRITQNYVVVNPEDFKALTGVDPSDNIAAGLPTEPMPMFELGSCLITYHDSFREELFDAIPAEARPLVNDFSVAVADAYSLSIYGLDPNTALPSSPGEVTYIRSSESCIGTMPERLTLSAPTTLSSVGLAGMGRSDYDILEQAPSLNQNYSAYRVGATVESTSLDRDLILLHPTDYASISGRVSPYSEIYLDIRSDTDISAMPSILIELAEWSNGYFSTGEPTLVVSDTLWDILLTENGRYEPLLWVIAVLLGLSVPFIWFYPQYNYYRRRREEFFVLSAIGGTRSRLFTVLFGEGLILAGMSAVIAALLCPMFNAAFYILSSSFLELPFANALFDPTAIVASAVCSALCAGIVTVINARMLMKNNK